MEEQTPHIFSQEYYRRLGRLEEQHPWSAHVQRLALALLDRFGGGGLTRVLDAGCGAGYFTLLWRERSRPRLAVGLDLSVDGLHLCRDRGLRDVVAGSVEVLGFCGAAFDAITCADVLQHMSGPAASRALAEFARVLRPGGLLLVRAAARRGIGAKKHRDSAGYQQWEPEKLRAHLEACGFRIEWMSLANWLPSLVADLRAYRRPAPVGDIGLHRAVGQGGSVAQAMQAVYWAVERLVLLRLGWRLPGGHTLISVARKV